MTSRRTVQTTTSSLPWCSGTTSSLPRCSGGNSALPEQMADNAAFARLRPRTKGRGTEQMAKQMVAEQQGARCDELRWRGCAVPEGTADGATQAAKQGESPSPFDDARSLLVTVAIVEVKNQWNQCRR